MKRLSIIVPFYNVEKYIEECIRSLYKQDIPQEDYEVICVDDCSTDNSRDIILTLQKDYPCLILVTLNKNRKLGGARNAGLERATGEYIWFVDSDDFIEQNCFASLLNEAEKDELDILHFNYYELINSKLVGHTNKIHNEEYTGQDFALDDSMGPWTNRIPVVWDKIIKRTFLVKNNLLFAENVMFEDTDFSLRMFALPSKVRHINCTGYIYRINLSSITHQTLNSAIIIYKVKLLERCSKLINNEIKNTPYCSLIISYIKAEAYQIREMIHSIDSKERINYSFKSLFCNYHHLHPFCNWRTWFAIKYGIVLFIPNNREPVHNENNIKI